MVKLSVSEYARRLNVSVNTIYKKIKRGSIDTVEVDGKKYVMVDDVPGVTEVTPEVNSGCNALLKIIKRRDKEVSTLQKEIKRLTKKNEDVFASYLGQYQKALEVPKDTVDVGVKKKKKRKK